MVNVSVIIPVYNAEDYLRQSLDCIVNQTMDDIEVICVDDGSVDSSWDILKDYESRFDNFQIFHQENQGGGAARNHALTKAVGKYIYFMDADDILDVDALRQFYEISEEKELDFLIFQATNYDEDTGEHFDTDYYLMNELYEFVGDKVFSFDDLGDHIFDFSVTPWCKFYNREFVIKTGSQFAEGLIFHDNIFFWGIIFDAERMFFYPKKLYTRRLHSKSSTGAGDKRYVSSIAINNMIVQRFIDHGYFEKYREKLYNRKIKMVFNRYSHIQDIYKEFYYGAMKEDFMKLIGHEKYDDAMENLNEYNRSRFEKVVASRDFYEFEALMENLKLEWELKRLENKHERLQNRFDNLAERRKILKEQNTAYKKEKRKLEIENDSLTRKVGRLEDKIDRLEKTQEEIFNSNSWKLTKPLRDIKNLR